MTQGLYNREGGTALGTRYLSGDDDPTDFSWNTLITNETLLVLLVRNGKIRKSCAWVSREAIRPKFVMKKEHPIKGTKFGIPYTFDTVLEYLEWIGLFIELEKAYTWARLLGNSIAVMYKSDEGDKDFYEPLAEYDSLSAYYELTSGNGYQIEKKGDSYVYKITMQDILGNSKTFKVDKARVIPFNAPHLELRYKGNSEVEPMAKLVIVQEQMFRTIMKKLHEMGGGIDVIKVGSKEEKELVKASIDTAITYHSKIYTSDDVDKVFKSFVPELNAPQIRTIWDIAQEEIATDMNMSKKLISGDPQGAITSAKWDTEISYTEVYQTQRHYHKATEHVLFMLGIKDTTFIWNDPFPTEATDEDGKDGESNDNNKDNKDKEPEKDKDKVKKDDRE